MKKFNLFIALFLFLIACYGQTGSLITKPDSVKKSAPAAERRWGDGGLGIGLDYGGLAGVRASFSPIPYLGLFGAVGWDLVGVGWNLGLLGRLFPADGKHGARPYVKVMYGVNGVTKVTGKSGYDKLYYGVTPGIGIELRFGRFRKSGLNIDLNFPLRSPEFYSMIDKMKNDPAIEMKSSPLPVAFSIGYLVEF